MTSSANEEMRRLWAARGAAWGDAAEARSAGRGHHDRRLIEAAAVAPGQRVLDLASGPGDPALAIAETVGAAGLVVASDLAPEMLAGAVRRAAAHGLGNIRFIAADMEALPLADRRFDAVTCRFGMMFPSDTVRAAREALRVLRPGGRAAYLVHGPHAAQTGYAATHDTVRAFFGDPPSDPFGTRYRFAEPGSLSRVLDEAGFDDISETEHLDVDEPPVGARPWQANLARSAGARLAGLAEAERTRLDDALAAAFERLRDGETYRIRTLVRLVSGRAR